MSRIDEALRRSRAGTGGAPGAGTRRSRSGPPGNFTKSSRGTVSQVVKPTAVAAAGPRALLEEALIDSAQVISSFNSQWRNRLVVSPDSEPFLVEQFRRLAATLHHAPGGEQPRRA